VLRAWHALIPIGVFAVAAVWLRIRSESLLPPVVAHACYYLVLLVVIQPPA
jgi:hypothetical protein